MRMHNPPHPREVLKTLCLEPLKVSVTEAAKALGVSRKTLSAILMAVPGLVPRWQCVCRLPLARRQKAGLLSGRSMISGMPNSVARNFESGSLLHNLLSSGY